MQSERMITVKQTISCNKKEILLSHIGELEDGLSNLFHAIEEDEDIPEASFRVYEERINKLLNVYKEIKDEIYFS
jgi:hypothetical protein